MDDVTEALRDAAHVGVGFGVLAFQRAQVLRRRLERHLDSRSGGPAERTDRLGGEGASDPGLEELLQSLSRQLASLLDEVERHVPEPARELLATARTMARDAASALRGAVPPDAARSPT